jgi:hypothetical protein
MGDVLFLRCQYDTVGRQLKWVANLKPNHMECVVQNLSFGGGGDPVPEGLVKESLIGYRMCSLEFIFGGRSGS